MYRDLTIAVKVEFESPLGVDADKFLSDLEKSLEYHEDMFGTVIAVNKNEFDSDSTEVHFEVDLVTNVAEYQAENEIQMFLDEEYKFYIELDQDTREFIDPLG